MRNIKEYMKPRKTQKPKPHNSILPSLLCDSTVGGIGEMSLPLSLGSLPPIYPRLTMWALDRTRGWWVGKTKNASCGEPGGENVSSSERGATRLPGV